jgi:phage protein D
MNHDNLIIEIDDQEATDIYNDLVSLEVELDDELAAMFRIRLSILQQPDGVWTYIDDEMFRAWNHVVISAGFEDDTEVLIDGYITHVKQEFDPDPSRCSLDIRGMDASVLMDREQKLKAWPGNKDSDIASEIFGEHGLTPNDEDTQVIHDEAISTIIQRETDIRFLRRVALRNGFECFVEGDAGYFRPLQIDEEPQPVLAAHFGDETNLIRFAIEVNALRPVHVSMSQVDRSSKDVLEASAEVSQQTKFGEIGADSLPSADVGPGKAYVTANVATGNPEMTALVQAMFHQAEWFVTAEGEVAANEYGHILRPRGTVTVKGVGETYSGIYYVSHVTHSFTPDGYIQQFRAKRNAILPSGDEEFEDASLAGALL